jgi:hypothetical protein
MVAARRKCIAEPPWLIEIKGVDDVEEYQRIRAALASHSDQVFDLVATQLAYLGSKPEWSVDDNLDITEQVVRLAEAIRLPGAGDQSASALEFYRAAAAHLGFDVEE